MIRIGNQTSCWAARPLEPFDYALAQGFGAFEWFPDKKPGVGWDASDLDAACRNDIRQAARQQNLSLSVHACWQANPLDPSSRPVLAKDLDLARDLGATLLNIHLYHESGLDTFIDAIAPLLRLTAEAGIQLAIENTPVHPPELFNELFARLRLRDSLPTAHAGMCLDIGHANLCAATLNDYIQFVDRLSPQVPLIHLHFHENWGDADRHLPLFTGPAAQNDAGIRALIQRIQARDYSGSIILEQWPQPPQLLNQARDRLLQLLALPAPETPSSSPARSLPLSEVSPPTPTQAPLFAGEDFAARLVSGDKKARSWREKLDLVRSLLAEETAPLQADQLVDVAIYLRMLGTGQIQCIEDGRHFRPGHHARIAEQIHHRLGKLGSPELLAVARKIYPWLPSTAQAFQRAEPLTRIRDIAHRNDIPSDLKREIKTSLQNKLHRCAGPEDLETSARILERITAPGARYSAPFVDQFKIFHQELEEFFNARSLEDRLQTLPSNVASELATTIRSFLGKKDAASLAEQLDALRVLTELRQALLAPANDASAEPGVERILSDISLEDFAFVLVSKIINFVTAEPQGRTKPFPSPALLEALRLTVANLGLSGVMPEECQAIEAELQAWTRELANREDLLRLKATAERSRRLAESYSDTILKLFPRRAELLGRALGVPEHAAKVFSEAEIRSHLVFQLSKLLSALLRQLRRQLALPDWDVIVAGETRGRVQVCDYLACPNGSEPVVVLLNNAEGDEEIPRGIAALVLKREIPHLSHLGVRARQAGIPFVATSEAARFEELAKQQGQFISLSVSPEKVSWKLAPSANGRSEKTRTVAPARIPEANLAYTKPWLLLAQASVSNAGGKADGARRLAELAQRHDAGFKTPPGLVIPFGVVEAALETSADYRQSLAQLANLSPGQLDPAADVIRACIDRIAVPREILSAIQQAFPASVRLMVRSSANCEDIEQLAGAGLYESVANVGPTDAAPAIRQVWASLWTRRAVLSRAQAGIPHARAHMGVLIQQMIVPDFSFILHTRNPISQNPNEVYAEIAPGLGETLASGYALGTPYRLVCNRLSGAVDTVAFANFSGALRPAPAGGLQNSIVNYAQVELSCQADARRALGRRLAQIAQLVERELGSPQDIEGAVANCEFYLVQARPQQGLAPGATSPP